MIYAVAALGGVVGLYALTTTVIRLAPHDADRWHQPVAGMFSEDFEGGAVRVVQAPPEMMVDLHEAIMLLPRTRVLQGSLSTGLITYVTRSAIMGFPDYITLEQGDNVLKLHSRLRFGTSDMGVNRRRLDQILERVGLGG